MPSMSARRHDRALLRAETARQHEADAARSLAEALQDHRLGHTTGWPSSQKASQISALPHSQPSSRHAAQMRVGCGRP